MIAIPGRRHLQWVALTGAIAVGAFIAGCEKKEKILDIDTPGGGIEINKTGEDYEIEVQEDDGDTENVRIDVDE